MSQHNDFLASMKKSVTVLAGASAVIALLGLATWLALPGWPAAACGAALLFIAAITATFAQGGRTAVERQRRIDTGLPDLFAEANRERSEAAVLSGVAMPVGGLRHWIAGQWFDHHFLVGDSVRVKSYDEIRSTLDAQGKLDGLSFMEEMKALCGQPARVYRVLDKIYDYRRSRNMRQTDRCVLLVGLRCDGRAHDGCDAACYLVWKEAWLDRAQPAGPQVPWPVLGPQSQRPQMKAGKQYSCQYTELTAASRPSTAGWLRWLIEPWIVGNTTGAAWQVAALTRAFNWLQERRGGVTYPARPDSGGQTSKPGDPVQCGDWVRVRSSAEIAETLDGKGHHRGLWFDVDLLKHCGRSYRVLGRVERIVDIRNTQMIPMKTACIVLDDVDASGEGHWFGEQHDYLYWREAWLQPVEAPAAAATTGRSSGCG